MNATDYFAIQNRLNLYFRYVDAGDFAACAGLFDKAEVTFPQSGQSFSHDVEGLERHMRSYVQLYDGATPRTVHHGSPPTIEPLKTGTVRTSSSAVIFQATETLRFQAIGAAFYCDRFARTDDAWHFTHRSIELRFAGDLSHHLLKEIDL